MTLMVTQTYSLHKLLFAIGLPSSIFYFYSLVPFNEHLYFPLIAMYVGYLGFSLVIVGFLLMIIQWFMVLDK